MRNRRSVAVHRSSSEPKTNEFFDASSPLSRTLSTHCQNTGKEDEGSNYEIWLETDAESLIKGLPPAGAIGLVVALSLVLCSILAFACFVAYRQLKPRVSTMCRHARCAVWFW